MSRYDTLRTTLRTDADYILDQFGEDVIRRIGGSTLNTQTIVAVVDQDDELGGGMDGDGLDPHSQSGSRRRRSVVFDVKHDVVLDETDTIEFEGEVWAIKRTVARDTAMKTYSGMSIEGITSKRARTRP